jgi:rubrerythrin
MEFLKSETCANLMRAFAGESQARNRYTIAAEVAEKQHLYVIQKTFLFTADQEKVHGKIFYEHLREASGQNIHIDGAYPVDICEDVSKLLYMAARNEAEEFGDVYPHFADVAEKEGYQKIAASFRMIAGIEKIHGQRFTRFAEHLENGTLFAADKKERWFCLNCGYVYEGEKAPAICPVCKEEQGYFIRADFVPFV